jgi:CheY-like chemotaxis protein
MARPKVFVVRAFRLARRASRVCLKYRIFLLLLGFLTVGLLPAQPPSKPAPGTPLYEIPPEWDTFHQDEIRHEAREATERYRMRITVPQAAFASTPPSISPTLADRGVEVGAPAANIVTRLLCVLGALAFWVLIARKLVPDFGESLANWLPSRALLPSVPADRLVTLLAEEKSVSEFQAALRTGTRAPESGASEEFADVHTTEAARSSAAIDHIRKMIRLLQEASQNAVQSAQRRFLLDALDEVRPLKNLAKSAELLPLHQVTCAVEMLLKQLTGKTSNMNSSSLRTATFGVTLLEELCQPGLKPDLLSDPPLRLLVVDDETFSRYALSNSLKRGLSEPDVAETGESALTLAAKRAYDLILLDVQMPGMDGFELCSRIHETVPNRATPVVFVTSLRDFDARANSILCGGRDLIAKPFLTFELTVKALTLVAKERLLGRGRMADACVDEAIAATPAAPLAEPTRLVADHIAEALPKTAPALERKLEPEPAPLLPTTSPPVEDYLPETKPAGQFFVHARAQIDMVRELVERIRITSDQRVQREMITDLLLGVHLLAANAEESGQDSIVLMTSSLEGLLKKLLENVTNLTSSTLQAVSAAAALIQDLCTIEPGPDLATVPPIRALVVDDDPVALRALTSALQMRFSKPESASDGKSATALATEKPFDVIFLDVQMPDLDGFEVCSRIRETSANCRTPVIFLTGNDAPAMRAKSEIVGGSDFLAKSCLGSELTLKALSFALRRRLQNTWGKTAQSAVEIPVMA